MGREFWWQVAANIVGGLILIAMGWFAREIKWREIYVRLTSKKGRERAKGIWETTKGLGILIGILIGLSIMYNKVEQLQNGVMVICKSNECAEEEILRAKICKTDAMAYGTEITANSSRKKLPQPGRAVKNKFETCILKEGLNTRRCSLDEQGCIYFPLQRGGYGGGLF